MNFTTDEKDLDIKFLLDRARKAGSCFFTDDRDTGTSSNSIVDIAYGIIKLEKQKYPGDMSDLKSCERMWDKLQPWDNFSQWEMAWTSFDKPAAIFKYSNTGGANLEKKIHPTQKPIALGRWLIQKYAKEGDLILDTHSGSGTFAIAAYLEKHDFISIEKDYDFWKASVERLEEIKSQGLLF